MNLKSGDKVYCHTSNHRFKKGKIYTIFYINSINLQYFIQDRSYIQAMNINEKLDTYFTTLKEIRKNKLDKLNNYEI